ncbi:MAG: efflux transporter periplasmic adaptor subunit, partial [Acetobacteraceae bacterium]|nr:efflux transporter periplasmic adaptor subunit [Acetobacteraceae bacterium]
TVTLRAVIANPLLPGMQTNQPGNRELVDNEFVTVSVQGAQPVQALTIPRTAVLSDQQGSYVWVVGGDNKVAQRRVQLGQPTPTLAVIAGGLQDGETVVVDGVQRVRPGIQVNPAPASPGPVATAAG